MTNFVSRFAVKAMAATITVLSLYSASAQSKKAATQAAASTVASTKIVMAHTEARLTEAKKIIAVTGKILLIDPQCLSSETKKHLRRIQLDWDSGSIFPSRIDYSGPVCFELHNFNDILYTPSFSLTEKPPLGSALDLLKDAISTVTGFSVSGQNTTDPTKQASKQPKVGPESVPPQCPQQLSQHIASAQATAALLQSGLSQLDPGKDANGKINLIPLATSLQNWQPIPMRYQEFQAAVSNLVVDLKLPDIDVCSDTILGLAESVVIDAYLPIQQNYPTLAAHAASPHMHASPRTWRKRVPMI